LHTLLIGLQTTFREKLEWLEEAENLTLRFRVGRASSSEAVAEDPPGPGAGATG
jgi:hypothetical protein